MRLNLTKPIIFFDLETTGVNVSTDRIVEISMIKIMPDGEEIIKTERINPERPIPAEVSEIHGIYDNDVKDKPTFKDRAVELKQFIGNCDLAGYNCLKFDIPLLVEEFLRAGVDFEVRNRNMVDVQNIFHEMEQRTLKAAYKFYCDKDLVNAHSAEADTIATLDVLKAQIERYDGVAYVDKKGNESFPVVNNMKALAEFSNRFKTADLSGRIVFNDQGVEVFNFGKYKGKSVEEVFSREPQYYDWMMRSEFPHHTKKIITEIKLRAFNKK